MAAEEVVGSRHDRRLKTQQQHANLVDEIERGLSRALQDYRYHAEEVLAKFLVELERRDAEHELEVSKLRAENSSLRDRLGLSDPAGPELFQQVLFAQNGGERSGPLHKVRAAGDDTMRSPFTPPPAASEVGPGSATIRSRKQEQPGGAWQYFVAWVPNGAALHSPEPWKPLPPLEPIMGNAPLPGNVPGMVPEDDSLRKNKTKKGEDSECSTDSEECEQVEVLEVWKATQRHIDRLRKSATHLDGNSRHSGSATSSVSNTSSGSEEQDEFDVMEERPWWLIHPHGRKRATWDVLSLLLVVYDMFAIPLSAFDLSGSVFLTVMDWTTRLFWTCDVAWSILTAVALPDGKISFDQKYILRRYLKTWFALDCLLVGSDWSEVVVASTSIVGLGRLARIFRLARIVRLLRLLRMREVLNAVTERIQSDKLVFMFTVGKLLIFVLVAGHVLACLWWAIGDGEEETTWTVSAGVRSRATGEQYLVCLHWALCQLTGGMDEFTPANAPERLFAVFTWVFGFTAAAVVCSIMTSNLTHAHIIGGQQDRQLSTLKTYLKQNSISRHLALRVQRSAQYAVTADLAPESVELLSVVAEPLRVEMNFEMFSPILANHPLFADWIADDPGIIRRVCHVALGMVHLGSGDVVFSKGETPRQPKMYFIIKGLLDYHSRGQMLTIGERQWVAEPALWTVWTHRGTLTAVTEAKMATLDATTFRELVQRFRSKRHFDPRVYVADFIEHINKTPQADDLTVPT